MSERARERVEAMTGEIDVYRSAKLLIDQHGEGAAKMTGLCSIVYASRICAPGLPSPKKIAAPK